MYGKNRKGATVPYYCASPHKQPGSSEGLPLSTVGCNTPGKDDAESSSMGSNSGVLHAPSTPAEPSKIEGRSLHVCFAVECVDADSPESFNAGSSLPAWCPHRQCNRVPMVIAERPSLPRLGWTKRGDHNTSPHPKGQRLFSPVDNLVHVVFIRARQPRGSGNSNTERGQGKNG